MHFGIDFGAKLAGTTVICYDNNKTLYFEQSENKQDADLFVQQKAELLQPDFVFIDAPLSIPDAYYGKGDDFHYRICDREMQAMSPMFLGGLTARAMKLCHLLDVKMYETYPSYFLNKELKLSPDGKRIKQITAELLDQLCDLLPVPWDVPPANIHQLDALAAWFSGYRWFTDSAIFIGDSEEGLIII